jgi:transcriptional regulator with XRE-family HTH domain
MKTHWTERSTENFLSRITFDFIAQLEEKMESIPLTQSELAEKLNVTEGRVSQILNNRSNLTLKNIIKYARALGMKVAVVAYEDGDPDNTRGLVNSEIFSICWEKQGKPADYFSLEEPAQRNDAEISNVRTSPKFATEPVEQVANIRLSVDYIREVKPTVTKMKAEANRVVNQIATSENRSENNAVSFVAAA